MVQKEISKKISAHTSWVPDFNCLTIGSRVKKSTVLVGSRIKKPIIKVGSQKKNIFLPIFIDLGLFNNIFSYYMYD